MENNTSNVIDKAIADAKAIIPAAETVIKTVEETPKQSRWKSYVLWAAIAGQVLAVLQFTGAFKAMGIDAGTVGNVIAIVLQVLVAVGVINNPENPAAI